jgi:hypothetical protein
MMHESRIAADTRYTVVKCPAAPVAETIYFDLLRQARRHAVTKTTLTPKDEGGQDILIFKANEGRAPDRP